MEQLIIETPHRVIQLKHMPGTLNSFEAEAVETYTKLHHFVYNMVTRFHQWYKNGVTLMDSIPQWQQRIEVLENELKLYGELAGHTNEEADSVAATDHYSLKPAKLKEDVLSFQVDFTAFYEAVRDCIDAYMPIENDYEEYDQLFSNFNYGYFSPILRNYETAQLDIVSLDDDFEHFRESLAGIDDLRDKAVDVYNELPVLYESVMRRVDGVYRRLERVFNTIKQWEKMHNTPGEISQLN